MLASLLLLHAGNSGAARFSLPADDDDLIGEIQLEKATRSETLLDVARRHDIGQEEIQLANPGLDRWLPEENEPLLIPSRYILPEARREGLVLNLPEMRIYFFPPASDKDAAVVDTYPVSIGRMDWKTPLGETRIVSKQRNPSWRPPQSVRQEAAAEGESIPQLVPPGPDVTAQALQRVEGDARDPWLRAPAAGGYRGVVRPSGSRNQGSNRESACEDRLAQRVALRRDTPAAGRG